METLVAFGLKCSNIKFTHSSASKHTCPLLAERDRCEVWSCLAVSSPKSENEEQIEIITTQNSSLVPRVGGALASSPRVGGALASSPRVGGALASSPGSGEL